jgi:polyhydroxyalkanoate synthesis regulator phasin
MVTERTPIQLWPEGAEGQSYQEERRRLSRDLWAAECKRLGREDGTLPDEAGERVYLEARLLSMLLLANDARKSDVKALAARIEALEAALSPTSEPTAAAPEGGESDTSPAG